MTVITAVPHTDHLQRHYLPPPQRLLPSTPDGTYYAQHSARQNMARHELPPQAIRPLTQRGQPLPESDAHRVTTSSSTSTSLTGSMRFDATASHGLRGAFAGSWSSARTSLAYSAEPTGSPWTQRDSDRMDEDDKYDTSSGEPGSLSSLSRRPSLARFSRLSSESLTEMFGRLPAPSESDLILGTSKPRHHPATFSPDAQRARARSWQGDESVRLPPLRMLDSPRVARDDLPRVDASEPPAKRACVQLPSFPDYFEGSSRLSFSSSSVRSRGGTSSPPPSPSPSAASWSTPAHSTGHTDTEPTDEEDLAMGEDERQSGYSPQSLAAWKSLQERYARPRAISPVRPSSPLDDDSANLSSPQHVAVGAAKQVAASGCQAPRSRPSKSAAEHEQKKYRFVASTLSQDALPFEVKHAPAHAVERGRESIVRPGAKRKHGRSPSPSSASSEDLPLSSVTKVPAPSTTRPALKAKHHAPSDAPPSAATDPPKRRGRPPRPAYDIECLAPLHPDSPEAKGHFPDHR
ncbi:hypothetical protein BN946_scf184840.g2 [Trametes cinnabarina]|uniref:Uncharacterized protein n=1 Tax=Pycnoporus cinnabarinus TaxID=5643 RepID=A0A060STQ4_PYCCI|nr:hypothetical protein BN946_scf184840.g2 [Trametes cinnabarina]